MGRVTGDFDTDYETYVEFCDDGRLLFEEHDVDDSPAVKAVVLSAQAQLEDLLGQVYQMEGMFDDDDGEIERAIEDAEAWPRVVE